MTLVVLAGMMRRGGRLELEESIVPWETCALGGREEDQVTLIPRGTRIPLKRNEDPEYHGIGKCLSRRPTELYDYLRIWFGRSGDDEHWLRSTYKKEDLLSIVPAKIVSIRTLYESI